MKFKQIFAVIAYFLLSSVLMAEALPPLGQRIYLMAPNPSVPAKIIQENKLDVNVKNLGAFLKDPGFPNGKSEQNGVETKDQILVRRLKKIAPESKKVTRSSVKTSIATGESYFTAKAKFPRAQLKTERVVSHIQDAPIQINYEERARSSETQLLK